MINAQTEESPNEAPAPEVNTQKDNTKKNYSELVIYIKVSVHSKLILQVIVSIILFHAPIFV